MVFSDLTFVCGFLPAALIPVFALKRRVALQNLMLFLLSLLFYAWGEPKYVFLLLAVIVFSWVAALVAESCRCVRVRKIVGFTAVFADVAVLFWFKYAGWVAGGLGIPMAERVLPIGISFFVFQAVSYVADVALLEKYSAERNPLNVGLYLSFFPQLIAGPIVRYEEIRNQIRERQITIAGFEKGAFRFCAGFVKKVLVADTLSTIVAVAFGQSHPATAVAWTGAIAYTLQLYFDFSGYSDMAIGLGGMFGFSLPENFNNPYHARSIRDFWRRWHITLSIWFRDYVYIPLGGNRKGRMRTVCNVAVVWLLTGLWHGANLTFVVWGAVYGALVLAEKALWPDGKGRSPHMVANVIQRVVCLVVIVCLWVIFRSDNIGAAVRYLGCMFHGHAGLNEAVLCVSEYKYAFLLGIGLCIFPAEKAESARVWLWPIVLLLFYVAFVYLVKGSFSPFLYFNF